MGNDPIYNSEINAFNFCYDEDTIEAGPYSHTGDTSEDLLRTYTVGGISGKGTKLCFLTLNCAVAGAGDGTIAIRLGGFPVSSQSTADATTATNFFWADSNTLSLVIPVDDADVITIFGKLTNGASTISITNIKFWTTDQDVTFTGS